MSDSDEQGDSILDNLNKTRELWSSKADLGTPNYLIPKSPTSHPTPSKSPQSAGPLPNGNAEAPVEIVRSDDQVVEEYELPDIKSMRSQWEVPNSKSTAFVPLPVNKSPAVIAREKSVKEKTKDKPPPEIVNREEENPEETYEVELTKLKAQFESAARAASKTRPKSPKAPMPKTVIKDQVNRSSLAKRNSSRSFNKQLRFEDEMTSTGDKIQTEQRTETEQISVDLSGIKSQFEKRKDEHLITPELSVKRLQEKTSSNRPVQAKSQPLGSPSKEDSPSRIGDDHSESPRVEPVKSSEPVYDEMVGEESVKDRLQKYKSMTESTRVRRASVERKFSKRTTVRRSSVSSSEGEASQSIEEVVKSPPAGTREQPDYTPSVDLRQTKALFEIPEPKKRIVATRRRNSAYSSSESNPHSPVRSARSSSRGSRNSSRPNTPSPNRRSKSPANCSITRSSPISPTPSDMSDVVKPPPAGTKEAADYVPSVKISSLKSMFEKSKSSTSTTSAQPPRRRQLRGEDWANGNEIVEAKKEGDAKIVAEGSYENRQGVVKPPSAGTKERPAYNLSSDFLKSRAAMFDSPQPKVYTPRNKVSVKNVGAPTEVVNAESQPSDLDYKLSNSLKDTKKMFENGEAPPEKPTPVQRKVQVVATPSGEVVRPPPAGTRDESDIVPASNLNSTRDLFENTQEEPVPAARKEPIDIRQEAAESQEREEEVEEQTGRREEETTDSEGEYTLDNANRPNEEEEAAAITPIRVAVPEPEEPDENDSEKDFIKDEEDYPSEDVDQYDNDVPGLVEQGHEVQNDEDLGPEEEQVGNNGAEESAPVEDEVSDQTADESAPAPEAVEEQQDNVETEDVGDDQDPDDSGALEDDGTPDDVDPDVNNEGNEAEEAQVEIADNQEYEEENNRYGEDEGIVQKQTQSEDTTENGLNPSQETGMSHLDDSSHSDDSDDFDKPHFQYIHNEPMSECAKQPDTGDAMLMATSAFESSNSVDLLNGFSGSYTFAPPSNLGAEKPQSADPFDIFAPAAPSKTPAQPDPFDIFAPTPAEGPPPNGKPAEKDPFDLFF